MALPWTNLISKLTTLYNAHRNYSISARKLEFGKRINLAVTETTTDEEFQDLFLQQYPQYTDNAPALLMMFSLFSFDEVSTVMGKKIASLDKVGNEGFIACMSKLRERELCNERFVDHPLVFVKNEKQSFEYGFQECDTMLDGQLWYLRSYMYFMSDVSCRAEEAESISMELMKQMLLLRVTGRIYSVAGGLHVFVTSELVPHDSKRADFLRAKLRCTNWYAGFSKQYGYKVRLSAKPNRGRDSMPQYLLRVGKKRVEINDIVIYTKIHDSMIAMHQEYN